MHSVPDPRVFGSAGQVGVEASIDWDALSSRLSRSTKPMTGIDLRSLPADPAQLRMEQPLPWRRLRSRWTPSMLARFVGEVHSFEAPYVPRRSDSQPPCIAEPLLFEQPAGSRLIC